MQVYVSIIGKQRGRVIRDRPSPGEKKISFVVGGGGFSKVRSHKQRQLTAAFVYLCRLLAGGRPPILVWWRPPRMRCDSVR